jgi:hypothetical protein
MINLGTKWLKLSLALGAVSIVFLSCNTITPNAETTQSLSQTPQLEATNTTDSTKLIVGDISELKNQTECNNLGDTLVYAETKNYFAYICGNKADVNQPTYFKAKPKNVNTHPEISGKALLGWQQLSFVGISGNYTYSLSIPLVGSPEQGMKPSLNIHPFIIPITGTVPEDRQHEELTKYLSIARFRFTEFKKFDRWWWPPAPDPLLDSKKKKFIKYLMDNRESLKVCEERFRDSPEGREEYSTLYRFDSSRYLLQLRCRVHLRYSSFNFFLISEQNAGLQVKFLTQPTAILKDRFGWTDKTEGRVINGRPLYNPQSKILGIHIRFSGVSGNGELLTFRIIKDKFELVELRQELKERKFYIDPILYPIVYP